MTVNQQQGPERFAPGIRALAADPRAPWDVIDASRLPFPDAEPFRSARLEHGVEWMKLTTICGELRRCREAQVEP